MPALDPQSLPRHTDRLYRAAWALCGSPEDAEDLVQETFARVLARPRMLHGQDELAYLMRALRNTFLTQRRTATRRPRVVAATIEQLEPVDPRGAERPEEAAQIREVFATIASLSENHRLALVAVDVMGLSHREAARILHTREATVATRVFRARERMARELVRDETPPTCVQAIERAGEPARHVTGERPPSAARPRARDASADPHPGAREPGRGPAREDPVPVRSLIQRGPT